MRRLAVLICLVLSSVAPPARADRTLTLDEVLTLARHANRDLEVARARLAQTAIGVEQAKAALYPTISAQGKYTHNYKEVTLDLSQSNAGTFALGDVIAGASGDPKVMGAIAAFKEAVIKNTPANPVIQPGEQLDAYLNATVPLVVPWAFAALDAAHRLQDANEASYRVTETTVLLLAAQGFFAAAGADELVLARMHAVEVAKKTLDDARARFETGVVNRVEVARAELALVRAEQAQTETVDTQAQAYRTLATVIQLREPFHVAPPEAAPTTPGDGLTLARAAEDLRPEYTLYRRNLDVADATYASNKWRWLPSLTGFGNLRVSNYAGFSGDHYAWFAGVSLDWLIYDGGVRDTGRQLARAQRRENELRLSLLHDTVSDEIENARRALTTRGRALDTARRSVALSKETLDLVRVQHDAGTATQLELLQAQDALVAAEVAVAQARFDSALAELTLQRAAGTFPRAP